MINKILRCSDHYFTIDILNIITVASITCSNKIISASALELR